MYIIPGYVSLWYEPTDGDTPKNIFGENWLFCTIANSISANNLELEMEHISFHDE